MTKLEAWLKDKRENWSDESGDYGKALAVIEKLKAVLESRAIGHDERCSYTDQGCLLCEARDALSIDPEKL